MRYVFQCSILLFSHTNNRVVHPNSHPVDFSLERLRTHHPVYYNVAELLTWKYKEKLRCIWDLTLLGDDEINFLALLEKNDHPEKTKRQFYNFRNLKLMNVCSYLPFIARAMHQGVQSPVE